MQDVADNELVCGGREEVQVSAAGDRALSNPALYFV
jgi:hypothetical protein